MIYIPLATKHRPTERSLVRPLLHGRQPDPQTRITSMRQRVSCLLAVLLYVSRSLPRSWHKPRLPALKRSTFVKPQLAGRTPSCTPAAGMPNAERNTAISRVLESGRTLEMSGHWADALTQYEEALHEYPEDHALQARFDVARLHYSLEQRYDDRSFRESLRTLKPQQALDQYTDLLGQDRRPLLHRSAVAGR